MEILCNGTDKERNEFSFRLMDEADKGFITFKEFYHYFSNLITHWSSLINKHVRLQKDLLQDIFNKIDTKKEGIIYCRQYSAALALNPKLLDWF